MGPVLALSKLRGKAVPGYRFVKPRAREPDMTVKVTRGRQITPPKTIRYRLEIEPGAVVGFESAPGGRVPPTPRRF